MTTNIAIGKSYWVGRVLSALAILFLSFDALMKLIEHPMVMKSAPALGFAPESMFTIGAILAVCVILYAIPRTAVLGAVLITGYLGGAVVTHLRVGNPLVSHTLFPIYFGVVVWLGLYLRDARVRALVAQR
ncbi:MAG TPA: DoxX family protein [Kofleriaceae bacterium]|jgi:hypothetical protein